MDNNEEQPTHKLHIETRGKVTRLMCSDCGRPFMTIENGIAAIDSKHGPKLHSNRLTLSHARMLVLLLEMSQGGRTPAVW